MLSQEDFKVGARVRCVYPSLRNGHTGTIVLISRNSGKVANNLFTIDWDNDHELDGNWGCLDSFELISEENTELDKTPVDALLKDRDPGDPCPRCYYGIGIHLSSCNKQSSYNGF